MSADTITNNLATGLDFLKSETPEGQTYTPSDFTEEHKMIKQSVDTFQDEEIHTNVENIENQQEGLNRKLMRRIGDLGFLSAHMPEEYGGINLDFISNMLIAEGMGGSGSFSVSYNAHTGIGMLPILYFGTEAQKMKYLPKLCTGELVGAYCLTEPGSGSDALAAKSKATLSEDGKSFVLNGQKMWISNAGFADVFIVFAQAEGSGLPEGQSGFTGFIVDKGTPGMTLGAEEKKLGIKGSSTRQVFFENTVIPFENVLGDIGKGHLIAFNVLNIGRYKLGVSCLGGCKRLTASTVKYANERHQFKVPIASFGAIKHKIGEQYIRTYALESSVYRLAGLMDSKIKAILEDGKSYTDAKLLSAEEYALECSIIKILGSEVLDYVVDETVQTYGGMGYSEEGHVARSYRDSRINRIFEGTNEINRLLILNMIFKKAMKGEFDIATPAMAVQSELMNQKHSEERPLTDFYEERKAVKNFKKVLYLLLGYAGQLAMNQKIDLKSAQEPLMNMADIIMDIFQTESTMLRIEKVGLNDERRALLKTLFYDANARIQKNALDVIGSIVEESMIGPMIGGVKKLTRYPVQNTMKNRRIIADKMIGLNGYRRI